MGPEMVFAKFKTVWILWIDRVTCVTLWMNPSDFSVEDDDINLQEEVNAMNGIGILPTMYLTKPTTYI